MLRFVCRLSVGVFCSLCVVNTLLAFVVVCCRLVGVVFVVLLFVIVGCYRLSFVVCCCRLLMLLFAVCCVL